MNDPFQFDPNSTKNEGRWRLIDPKKFVDKKWFRVKNPNYPGLSYVFGVLKETGKQVKQTIRFDKKIWTQEKASEWWEEHKDDYHREWSQRDWDNWQVEKDKQAKENPNKVKIPRDKAIQLSKTIIQKLEFNYVAQNKLTIDFRYKKGLAFPVGSIRRGKDMVGDVDILITSSINKQRVKELMGDKITNLVGKEKKIDFDYHYITRNPYQKNIIRVNLFVTLDKDIFGAALIHHTGPFEYNIYIRKKVKSFGWKLSQNGLSDEEGYIIPTPTERILQEQIGVTIRKPSERKG